MTAASVTGPGTARFALFAYGFRPFFLISGLSAAILVPAWLVILAGGLAPAFSVPPAGWHGHEMLFGFVGAAVGGFMLTAIPSWTGARPVTGAVLAGLVALFLAGRIASLPALAASPVAAAVDLAFFPALGLAVAVALIRAGKARNTAFLGLLALLTLANLLVRLEWAGATADTARHGTALAIGVVLMMIAVVGGRIIPAFTRNALRRHDPNVAIEPAPWADRAALFLTAALVPLDLVLPGTAYAGLAALAAAAAHAVRLSRWQGHRTLNDPLLWILHAGYAWLCLGLALKGVELTFGLPLGDAWLHALTAGCFATMILAVMSRAALGHTGRSLEASHAITAAYILVVLAGLVRTAAPVLALTTGGDAYQHALGASGLMWTAGFGFFCILYAPILLRPRPDGRPG